MDNEFTASGQSVLLRASGGGGEGAGGSAEGGLARCHDVSAELTSPQHVRSIIKARAARRKFFSEHLFSDPAWDMLLELYALKCEELRVSVTKLSIAAGIPGTTALRWIDKLESEQLLFRSEDPLDGRRIWIELSESGLKTMRAYLQQLSTGKTAI